jgi:hypothetical protein
MTYAISATFAYVASNMGMRDCNVSLYAFVDASLCFLYYVDFSFDRYLLGGENVVFAQSASSGETCNLIR